MLLKALKIKYCLPRYRFGEADGGIISARGGSAFG